MKLTKPRLKQIIKEELETHKQASKRLGTASRLPQARDFGSTEPEMHAQFDTQKERIEDYIAAARDLHVKMTQYVDDYENVGPGGESDLGGLTPKWRNLLDALKGVEQS